MNLQEIEARLAQIRNEINTRGANMTAEELTALENEVTQLVEERGKLLAAANTQEQRNRILAAVAAGQPVPGADGALEVAPTVLRSFPAAGGTEAEAEDRYGTVKYRKAFMNYVLRGTQIPVEYRADAVSTTTDVGAVIPTTVLNQIVQKLESTGMILAKVTRTAYKGGVAIPVSTVKPVATWVNEGKGSDKQKHGISKEGMITFAYHKLRCAVAVSLEVDTMAMSAFESLLINNIVEAMTKALEQSIISGTGSGQPSGIIKETPAKDQAITTKSATELSYADLIAVEAALPQAYENGAEWCMSKATFMGFIGMTDANGQPIARVNYGIGGKPERTLLGRPVECCDYIGSFAAAAAGDVVAFVFRFKDYVLNTNYAMGVKKYEDNDTDDQVTKGIMLADGKVVDKNSLVTLKKKAA